MICLFNGGEGGSCLCRWNNSCLATLNSARWVATNSRLIEINLKIKSVETWIIRQLPTDKSHHPRIQEVQSRANIRLGLTYLLFTLSPYRLTICSTYYFKHAQVSSVCNRSSLPRFNSGANVKFGNIAFNSGHHYRSVCLYSPKSLIHYA